MCADVAAGLAYLLKEHWIHGDLGESIEQGALAPRCGIVRNCATHLEAHLHVAA